MPSLAQLDQAVREFLTENPEDVVTVVVDASFGHRIDGSESKIFDEAEAAGELVSPPAGAIGRGDAFLLRIADKTGATVLSNDSFQEFHGDYDWLFERGRLIGGKPVPGVGWIFTPRTPVRGPRSREAVKEAKRKTKDDVESAVPGLDLAAERARGKGKGKKTVERAIAVALEEAVSPDDKRRRRRKGGSPPADPVNPPLAFITFIAAHPLGAEVTATVDSFASHGAFVECEGARCYVPLSGMGDPPPKSAREVFTKGQVAKFVIQALDPQRRGVELAVPGFAKIAGAPTEETVAAEIEGRADEPAPEPAARRPRAKKAVAAMAVAGPEDLSVGAAAVAGVRAPARRAPARRAASVRAVAGEQVPARKRSGRTAAGQPTAGEPAAAPVGAPEEPKPAARNRRPAAKRAAAATPEPLAAIPEPEGPEAPPAPVRRGRRRAEMPVPPAPVPAAPVPAAPTPAAEESVPEVAALSGSRRGGRRRAISEPTHAVPPADPDRLPVKKPARARNAAVKSPEPESAPAPAAPEPAGPAQGAAPVKRGRASRAQKAAAAPQPEPRVEPANAAPTRRKAGAVPRSRGRASPVLPATDGQ